jgi:glycosyltransferase involved in cell wall biosynthesis
VVPFYNEADTLLSLVNEVLAVCRALPGNWEFLLINDGSQDNTAALLTDIELANRDCRIVTLDRNSGQAAALWTGLQQARGSILITMDGDGQNVPADIPYLLEALEGADMVVGIRQHRKDTPARRWISRLANAVRRRILRDNLRDSGCALKAFRHEVVHALIPIRTLYSFMPAMAAAAGFKLRQIPVRHRDRTGGKSNYGFLVFLWRPLLDLLGMWWFIMRSFPQIGLPRNTRDETPS